MGRSVLVVAAHPEDEILGCGGTRRRHVVNGDTVHVLIVCEGETVRYQGREVGLAEHARQAAEIIGDLHSDAQPRAGGPDAGQRSGQGAEAVSAASLRTRS